MIASSSGSTFRKIFRVYFFRPVAAIMPALPIDIEVISEAPRILDNSSSARKPSVDAKASSLVPCLVERYILQGFALDCDINIVSKNRSSAEKQ